MKITGVALAVLYHMGSIGTAIFLFVDTNWSWWNWILLIPLNLFLAEIWPVFWFIQLVTGHLRGG